MSTQVRWSRPNRRKILTDKDLPEQSSQPRFTSRRERREYQRALADGRRYVPSRPQLEPDDVPQQVARPGASEPAEPSDDFQPRPIPADGSGGLQQRPQRPQVQHSSVDVEERRYTPEINSDLGDLNPLPEDQRDYPDLSSWEKESESAADEAEEPNALGYMLVTDDDIAVPELDEEQLKARQARKRKRTLIMLTSFGVFLGLLAIVGIGVGQLIGWTNNDYPGPGGEEVVFEVNPGEGPIVIGNRLVEQENVASNSAFRDAIEAVNTSSEIQPGEYTLQYQMPARDAAETLLRGGVPGIDRKS